MTVTAFSISDSSPEFTLLNVARLFTRLEHNLLNPGSELHTLHKSELQRLRVSKNVEYARALLSQLERSLPQIKSVDQRHEAQSEIVRDRQLLKRMQIVLGEEESRTREDGDDDTSGDLDEEWKDLFSKPTAEQTTTPPSSDAPSKDDLSVAQKAETDHAKATTSTSAAQLQATTNTNTSSVSASATASASESAPAEPTSTLRNRNVSQNQPITSLPTATSTGSNVQQNQTSVSNSNLSSKEDALSAARLEQEDLTGSLLSLASQLKASSQSFQATLENEKSVLDRAVSGIDKTSSTMEAAGQKMGMLRRMTEGKGWWGRMMLYAWIFGLWVVAILIVYVGPKLRF
ncbi:hypothetical protein POX_c03615 [Penicillium oxalicum]|uniref:hypothetical protein n=1 Tax=Penicillium oxalicum TaxID=69781 RepID=UPI0020B817D5|nr:hypothetical protein POX_c03615 [Penicillium oxalicum]KAI2790766.1 hypothetical protein POX_c03615 [Penicillium oxalicum]